MKIIPVTLAERSHPFPSRTRKLSSPAPKILGGQLPGKIGRRRDFHTGWCPRRIARSAGHRASLGDYAGRVDRICPFLALEADLRTAMAGYDPEHRCLAEGEPLIVDRSRQQQRCLVEEHVGCERYIHASATLAERRGRSHPAPDARFGSTRLVIEPDDGWRPIRRAPRPIRRNRLALTGATLLVVGAAGAALSTRGFGLLTAASAPTTQPTATPTYEATVRPTPSPSAARTSAPSSKNGTSTAQPVTPSPQSTARVYVAQAGDSLSAIAARFGVSVQAIMSANGLANPNLVNVGQVLVIPE